MGTLYLDHCARRNENFVLVLSFVRRSAGYQGQSPWLVSLAPGSWLLPLGLLAPGDWLLASCSRIECVAVRRPRPKIMPPEKARMEASSRKGPARLGWTNWSR